MGLLSRLKKVTGLGSAHQPKPKDSSIMTENGQPAPEGALKTDGERKQKSFWKWAALHFPSLRKGKYDLARAEEKYGIEEESHWIDSDVPYPEVLPAAEEQQEQDVLDKVLDKGQSVHEPCVQPKDTPITSENCHPNLCVGAVETDGERKKAGREKMKNSFWKWPAFHFPFSRAETYDLAQAEEKYGIEAESHWSDSDVPSPEVLPAAEEQQEQDVLDKVLDKGQSVHEPCVQPKDTPITSENCHPNLCVGAVETDGGRKKAGREKMKNSFWKWPDFHFPFSRAETYDLAQAEEKYGIEAESHWSDSDGWSVHKHCVQPKDTPTRSDQVPGGAVGGEEVLLTSEEQLVQDILDKGHIRHQYKIGPMLGEGGCGSVYRGIRCKDGLKVAVKCSKKIPNMSSITVPGHPKRVPMEVGLMLMANNGLSVPHIIELLDWEEDKDHYVMVMERPVPCVDLFDFVNDHGGSLDEETARKIMWQVIDAAKTCCERGVFHRDIKLENLLVNQDTMEVKLIDFGCGALMKKSAFKVFHGTRPYCPPEFIMKGKYHAKPTTVWTLGFILYEMLCGKCPTSYDRHMITVNLWNRPGLSKECCQMICDCLQPDPQKRLSLDEMHLHDWFKVTE